MESCRERVRAGGDDDEEERVEREDAVLSAKCSLDREERTMVGKSHSFLFLQHKRH